MKKLLLLFVIIIGISTGCKKDFALSEKPSFFVVDRITQDSYQKNVARYRLQHNIIRRNSELWTDVIWVTLSDTVQIGDTLVLTKKQNENIR